MTRDDEMITGQFAWPKLTIEDINEALRKMSEAMNPYRKYTDVLAIGFCNFLADDEASALSEVYKYKDKRIILMKAGGTAHEAIKKIERKYDVHFDRLDKGAIDELWDKLHLYFTDEEGNVQMPPYEPLLLKELTPLPLSDYHQSKYAYRGWEYYYDIVENKVKIRNIDNEDDI